MKLEQRNVYGKEYRCKLTEELDNISEILNKHYYNMFYHYILANDYCKSQKCLAIRVPGRTVGGVWIDDNNVITKVAVNADAAKTYSDDINDLIQKFVGEIIEW